MGLELNLCHLFPIMKDQWGMGLCGGEATFMHLAYITQGTKYSGLPSAGPLMGSG